MATQAQLAQQGWGLEWETVIPAGAAANVQPTLQRVRVPGGWLCRTIVRDSQPPGQQGQQFLVSLSVSMAFVPTPPQ